MPPLHPGEPGEGGGDDHDPNVGPDDLEPDDVGFRPPLPPEDRIWRHPSEVALAPARSDERRSRWRTPALVTAAGAAGAALALAGVAAMGGFDDRVVERRVAVQPASDDDRDRVASLVERTAPSVAALEVRRDDGEAVGCAVVLRSDGYLLTDASVVRGAHAVDVLLHGGEAAHAEVVGIDESTGVAVVRIDADDLVPATLGRSSALRAGAATVLVATTADGGWHPSVETGVVSALAPRIEGADGTARYGMIVLDGPFGAGAAGGALVDASGAVVGIATAGGPEADGMATPIELVEHVAEQLIEHGRARHVWLGLHGTDLPAAGAAAAGIPGGAVVDDVVAGGPAASAGLRAGDVVVSVDGEATPSMAALITALRLHLPGDVVVLGVHRDGVTTDVRVHLAAKPA